MTRVLLFGTHPNSSNGYSLVATHLARHLAHKKDIDLTYWGFQNFHNISNHDKERHLPSHVQIYDAHANEKTKGLGFGFEEVTEFVTMNKPDVCIIYNDMVVVSNIIDKLKKVENRKFKIIVYVDQVYLCQKKEHIMRLNEDADFVICFSKYWEDCILEQGLKKPTGILEHGFNPLMNYPVPKKLARMYFNLKLDDFIIINANRNQPRKRLDIMMMAFAEVVSRHIEDPIKLLIATAPQGAWNLIEIYERELRQRGLTLEDGMKHIIFVDNPQGLTDEDMNILYNAADIGINTAMGEGWGLCNFQAAAIGTPQIVPNVGGFLDFFNKDSAVLIEPKVKVYTDMTIDGCPGCAEICDSADFAEAIESYYADEDLRKQHTANARKKITRDYKWSDLGEKLYSYIKTVMGDNVKDEPTEAVAKPTDDTTDTTKVSIDEIDSLMKAIDGDDGIKKENLMEETENKNVDIEILTEVPQPPIPTETRKQDNIKHRLKSKLDKRRLRGGDLHTKQELLKLKEQLAKLLKE